MGKEIRDAAQWATTRPQPQALFGEAGVKRFRFALQGLERLRQARVDQGRLVLARSEAARWAEEKRIMSLEREMEETAGASSREGILNTTGLLEEERYVGELRRQREGAQERLAQWITAVEEDRQKLLRARKKHKAIERLRERRYLEFVQEVMRGEGKVIDEAASVADWRRRKAA